MSENSSFDGSPAMSPPPSRTSRMKIPKSALQLKKKSISRLRASSHPSRGSYVIWLGLSKERQLHGIRSITQGQVSALVVMDSDIGLT